MAEEKRKALVVDRDPFENGGTYKIGSMQKIADADLVVVVKGDQAKIIKLRWADPADYEVEVMRP
jgi:hypothetical protein